MPIIPVLGRLEEKGHGTVANLGKPDSRRAHIDEWLGE